MVACYLSDLGEFQIERKAAVGFLAAPPGCSEAVALPWVLTTLGRCSQYGARPEQAIRWYRKALDAGAEGEFAERLQLFWRGRWPNAAGLAQRARPCQRRWPTCRSHSLTLRPPGSSWLPAICGTPRRALGPRSRVTALASGACTTRFKKPKCTWSCARWLPVLTESPTRRPLCSSPPQSCHANGQIKAIGHKLNPRTVLPPYRHQPDGMFLPFDSPAEDHFLIGDDV